MAPPPSCARATLPARRPDATAKSAAAGRAASSAIPRGNQMSAGRRSSSPCRGASCRGGRPGRRRPFSSSGAHPAATASLKTRSRATSRRTARSPRHGQTNARSPLLSTAPPQATQ
eukprot:15436719-Alexandrium_andersonii.AAC.1